MPVDQRLESLARRLIESPGDFLPEADRADSDRLRLEGVESRHDQHDAGHAHPVARERADEDVFARIGRRDETEPFGLPSPDAPLSAQ